jgi:trk system potassium uptake protein TrkA
VATVKWTTDQVMRVLIPDQIASDWRDPNAEIALVTLVLPDEWAGWKIEELEADGHRRVVGVTRTGHARIVGPGTVLQEGDQVHLAVDDGRPPGAAPPGPGRPPRRPRRGPGQEAHR